MSRLDLGVKVFFAISDFVLAGRSPGYNKHSSIGIPVVVLVASAGCFIRCEKPFVDKAWSKTAWNWVAPQKV